MTMVLRSGPLAQAASKDKAGGSSSGTPRRVQNRKSTAQRRAVIAGHAACGELEPARAFCTRCQSWVPLSDKWAYSLRPWSAHVKACGTGETCVPPRCAAETNRLT